ALIAAIALVLLFTDHVYCLNHLRENMDKNLSRALGGGWVNFQQDFRTAYRAVLDKDFESKWHLVVARYLAAGDSLHNLSEVLTRWAWAWVSTIFTAGIRTNGRVKSENQVTKGITGPGKNLFQVFTALNEPTKEQSRDTVIRVREAARKSHPTQLETLFKSVLDLLRLHPRLFTLQMCHQQLELSLYYTTHALQLPHGIRNWVRHLDFFSSDRPHCKILVPSHLLKIVHTQSQATHILVLFPDGRYMCDCCMQENVGVVCRHYFVAWVKIPGLPFT
ncbi:hypothetical protein B0H16DRAFT_1324425, partial [Mycena metata]